MARETMFTTLKRLARVTRLACVAGGGLVVSACSNSGSATHEDLATRAAASLVSSPTTQLVPWGKAPGELGLRAAVTERAAFGVPAVAVGPGGEVLILDAVKQRIVRLDPKELRFVANVPIDADDLAISKDGAIAVRRTMTRKIAVLDPSGESLGEVDAQITGDVDTIALGPSRRVAVHNAFQETFQLGGPSIAQLPAAVARSRKVGAELLPNGDGIVAIAQNDVAELRVVAQAKGDNGHAEIRKTHALGAATSVRIVGVSDALACLRLEHANIKEQGPLVVTREALCIDTTTGATVFRTTLADPGLYVPRRELTFSQHKLVFAHPEKEGLRVSAWTIEGGAK